MKHFTILVPTRNRADTLYWTLKSCLSQDYERMTVLVSDNCSTDDTQDVLASFSDTRLTCIRTPMPTSMSGNVEFALDNLPQEDTCVTGIGDDDGLLPGGLAHADTVFNEHPDASAITWAASNYCWPNCLIDDWRNSLSISASDHLDVLNARTMLAKLADYQVYYHHLPGLWTSLISARVLRQCRASLGRLLISFNPDAGSAVHIACRISTYVYTHRSVTMLGSSSHSTGVACSVRKNDKPAEFFAENTIPPHGDLFFAPHGVYHVTESLLQARDSGLLPPDLNVDLAKAVRLMLLRRPTDSDEIYALICNAAQSTAARHGIPFNREDLMAQNHKSGAAEALFNDPEMNEHADIFYHKCNPRLTANIFQATNLAGELLDLLQKKRLLTASAHARVLMAAKEKLARCKERNARLERKLADARISRMQRFLTRVKRTLGNPDKGA